MALNTNLNLDQTSITKLRELAQFNIDSRDGFDYAAERIEDDAPPIASRFRQFSDQRSKFAEQLDSILRNHGEQAQEDGSWSASLHRTWMNIRDMFAMSEKASIQALLEEAEQAEDTIKQAYEEAGRDLAGSLLGIINDQYAAVKAVHDEVRELRDSYKD